MTFGGPSACRNSTAPQTLSFTSAAISSFLVLITVPGNFLICLAVAKDPRKNLRTAFNLFLLNISAADLVVGLTVLPVSIAYHTLEGVGIAYAALTKALHLSFFISCSASVLSIAALSLDRYVCVTSPLKYRMKLTSVQVRRVSLGIWVISLAVSFTYLYVDFIIYTFVFANGAILFTLIVLIFVNHKISRSLRNRRKQLRSLMQVKGSKRYLTKRDSQVTRTFFLILCSFLVLTLPPMAFSYVLNFCSSCDCWTIHIMRDLGFISILFPSSVNPFIYALQLPNFRQALRLILYKPLPNLTADNSEAPIICESTSNEPVIGRFTRKYASSHVDGTLNMEDMVKSTPSSSCLNEDGVSLNFNNVQNEVKGSISRICDEDNVEDKKGNGISHYYRVTTNL